jgi:hypothetical protein
VYVCILKQKNVFLMVDRCICKDTKVFESFLNAFRCIYSVLHFIGNLSVFEFIKISILCIYSIFQCLSKYLNVYECILTYL